MRDPRPEDMAKEYLALYLAIPKEKRGEWFAKLPPARQTALLEAVNIAVEAQES